MQARADAAARLSLEPGADAIARSVLYAALFDYPLTLAELRRTLMGSRQTASEIVSTLRGSSALQDVVESHDGFFFPAGCAHLVDIRRRREVRSRGFLLVHRPLLWLIGACPFVRMVALSGSIAHLNLDAGGDLDLFIVTRGARVWSVAVFVVLLAKLLRRRRTLCANFIVADTDLRFSPQDLFAANQVVGLLPVSGGSLFQELIDANPFVLEHYPNFHAADRVSARARRRSRLGWLKRGLEHLLFVPSAVVEWVCRKAYRGYLQKRAGRWQSPEQVQLGDTVLKLHTRSHRTDTLDRFASLLRNTID